MVPSAERQQRPIRVLFLCTENAARSQIAEALLIKKGAGRFVAASAGTHPAPHVHPDAVATLQRAGIDWSGRQPKGPDAVINEQWDMLITLCDRDIESCANLPGRQVTAHWGIPDPAALADSARRADAFSNTLVLLNRRIDLMLALRPERLERVALEAELRSIPSQAPAPKEWKQ